MRLCSFLYAKDRDLLSSDPIYRQSLQRYRAFDPTARRRGPFSRPMDPAVRVWRGRQLVHHYPSRFTKVAQHGGFKTARPKGIPHRTPNRYPFLEGAPHLNYKPEAEASDSTPEPPKSLARGVSASYCQEKHRPVPRRSAPASCFRVLKNLLIPRGERSAIGRSTWDKSAAFTKPVNGISTAGRLAGKSIRDQARSKSHGAPATSNSDELAGNGGQGSSN